MVATKVPRLSSGVRFLGYTLLMPSLFILITSAACGIFMTGATGSAASEMFEDSRLRMADLLRTIDGVTPALVDDFTADGTISEPALSALSDDTRRQVDRILSLHTVGLTGAAIGGAAVTGIAGATVLILWVLFLPAMIVGGLLVLNKKVWKCPTCGYIFERA